MKKHQKINNMKKLFTYMMLAGCLMLVALSSQAQFKPSDFSHKILEGKINGRHKIKMLLNKRKRSKSIKNNLSGYYHYTRHRNYVILSKGTWKDNGSMLIEGGIRVKGKYIKTGAFSGRWNADQKKLIGTWTATGGTKSFPFELYETYKSGRKEAEMQWMDETTMFGEKAPRGAAVSFLYPVVKGGAVAQTINDYIQSNILRNPQERTAKFIKNYLEDKKARGFGDNYGYYEEHLTTINTNDKNILTLEYNLNGFSGGAHGYYNSSFTSFDLRTGQIIKMKDVFIPGFEGPIKQLIARQMRKDYGLKSDAPLTKLGLFKNECPLPKNFYFRPDGVAFFYNVYEIAPYVAGARTVVVPYKKLRRYIQRKSLAKKFFR
ncbi:hypothetical protein M23134_03667 [Microscilla marina ATCC 23134]|uniref:DUF3298 domain-containing protein n=2 Tax=Microscilla marina TaxID=1027 RepID=A1ZZC9_MICM2|nr:hypothetical protein M23134_03667 [Microscilla marina ATCC 23134]